MADAAPSTVMVACKWVDRRPTVDALTGEVTTDARSCAASDADDAALEIALRLGETWGREVVVASAGPPASKEMLRRCVASGASRAMWVDLEPSSASVVVASSLASVARIARAEVIVCGDASLDRGSGSVPAFLAAELEMAQALGLTALEPGAGDAGSLHAWRRLDGGRREHLALRAPCVVSVEGSTATLRRAPFASLRRALAAPIEKVTGAETTPTSMLPPVVHRRGPYKARTHVVAPPPAQLDARGRVLALSGERGGRKAPQSLVLEPVEAARRILEALEEWGEMP